jgi:hypothetical protein
MAPPANNQLHNPINEQANPNIDDKAQVELKRTVPGRER